MPSPSLSLRTRAALRFVSVCFLAATALAATAPADETIAFWAFDEPVGLYPSSVLSDEGPSQLPLLLGPGGSVVPGKFGNALSAAPQPAVKLPPGSVLFGLTQLPTPAGRSTEPLSWHNAQHAALMTAGENHLRKEFPHPNATETGLNLGAFDWTLEFWYRGEAPIAGATEGVVFEIGQGPRGENDHVTSLSLSADRTGFVLVNQPNVSRVSIPSAAEALTDPNRWTHLAFVHDAARRELRHHVDGRLVGTPLNVTIEALPVGEEAYFTLARNGRWTHALPGALDEFRVTRGARPARAFSPPTSHVARPAGGLPVRPADAEEPLRFAGDQTPAEVINLGSSKHLLIDDALFPQHTNVSFVPTPPSKVELAFEVHGSFRKHVTVVEDEQRVIRLYNPIGPGDRLGVRTSRDGLNFEIPRLSTLHPDYPNIVTTGSAGTPSVFIDPLAPPEERWKLVSGDEGQGIFVHTSPDGYQWRRLPTAAISAWSGSQSNMFYDDQRGQYVGYHRTDSGRTLYNKTERRFVLTILDTLRPPWPFTPRSQAEYDRLAATSRLNLVRPWYLDNGPLTPGGVGIEWPIVFQPTDGFDPDSTDIYVPKALK